MIRFVIPAYNEAENIPRLLADLAPRARALGARVIVVDDGSTDGTADVVRAHAQDMHLAVVRHPVNRGLGTAINTGIRAALGEASDDDAIVTLEADTTSDLDDLPRCSSCSSAGYDIVLASVYAPGRRDPRRQPLARIAFEQVGLETLSACSAGCARSTRCPRSTASTAPARCGAPRTHTATCSCASPASPPTWSCCSSSTTLARRVAEVPTINDWSTRKGRRR